MPSSCIITHLSPSNVRKGRNMMSDSNYGVMTARMPHCPLTCCASMDPTRDIYLSSACCTASIEPSYVCSTSAPAYHQFRRPYHPPVQTSTCHMVGWDTYHQCSTCQPRPEMTVHSPTHVHNLYPVTQSSHTSSAPVGLHPSSADLPPSGHTFTHPPAGIQCDEPQIIATAEHKIDEDKTIKPEGGFHSSFRALTAEGPYRSRLKHRLPRRDRLNFTDFQLMRLEESFSEKKYIIGADRKKLADELGISEIQVKNWYQNRRTRWKRERKPDDSKEHCN